MIIYNIFKELSIINFLINNMPLDKQQLRNTMINSLIKDLKKLGYHDVTPENIFKDSFCKEFSKNQINDLFRDDLLGSHKEITDVAKEILEEMEK